ncbi:MAG: hypothetical protein M1814_004056 [Vezdaea aestivalis]|nr:MAG: hypothetical protein M1814_004056 [Vezdaea aestivalis]
MASTLATNLVAPKLHRPSQNVQEPKPSQIADQSSRAHVGRDANTNTVNSQPLYSTLLDGVDTDDESLGIGGLLTKDAVRFGMSNAGQQVSNGSQYSPSSRAPSSQASGTPVSTASRQRPKRKSLLISSHADKGDTQTVDLDGSTLLDGSDGAVGEAMGEPVVETLGKVTIKTASKPAARPAKRRRTMKPSTPEGPVKTFARARPANLTKSVRIVEEPSEPSENVSPETAKILQLYIPRFHHTKSAAQPKKAKSQAQKIPEPTATVDDIEGKVEKGSESVDFQPREQSIPTEIYEVEETSDPVVQPNVDVQPQPVTEIIVQDQDQGQVQEQSPVNDTSNGRRTSAPKGDRRALLTRKSQAPRSDEATSKLLVQLQEYALHSATLISQQDAEIRRLGVSLEAAEQNQSQFQKFMDETKNKIRTLEKRKGGSSRSCNHDYAQQNSGTSNVLLYAGEIESLAASVADMYYRVANVESLKLTVDLLSHRIQRIEPVIMQQHPDEGNPPRLTGPNALAELMDQRPLEGRQSQNQSRNNRDAPYNANTLEVYENEAGHDDGSDSDSINSLRNELRQGSDGDEMERNETQAEDYHPQDDEDAEDELDLLGHESMDDGFTTQAAETEYPEEEDDEEPDEDEDNFDALPTQSGKGTVCLHIPNRRSGGSGTEVDTHESQTKPASPQREIQQSDEHSEPEDVPSKTPRRPKANRVPQRTPSVLAKASPMTPYPGTQQMNGYHRRKHAQDAKRARDNINKNPKRSVDVSLSKSAANPQAPIDEEDKENEDTNVVLKEPARRSQSILTSVDTDGEAASRRATGATEQTDLGTDGEQVSDEDMPDYILEPVEQERTNARASQAMSTESHSTSRSRASTIPASESNYRSGLASSSQCQHRLDSRTSPFNRRQIVPDSDEEEPFSSAPFNDEEQSIAHAEKERSSQRPNLPNAQTARPPSSPLFVTESLPPRPSSSSSFVAESFPTQSSSSPALVARSSTYQSTVSKNKDGDNQTPNTSVDISEEYNQENESAKLSDRPAGQSKGEKLAEHDSNIPTQTPRSRRLFRGSTLRTRAQATPAQLRNPTIDAILGRTVTSFAQIDGRNMPPSAEKHVGKQLKMIDSQQKDKQKQESDGRGKRIKRRRPISNDSDEFQEPVSSPPETSSKAGPVATGTRRSSRRRRKTEPVLAASKQSSDEEEERQAEEVERDWIPFTRYHEALQNNSIDDLKRLMEARVAAAPSSSTPKASKTSRKRTLRPPRQKTRSKSQGPISQPARPEPTMTPFPRSGKPIPAFPTRPIETQYISPFAGDAVSNNQPPIPSNKRQGTRPKANPKASALTQGSITPTAHGPSKLGVPSVVARLAPGPSTLSMPQLQAELAERARQAFLQDQEMRSRLGLQPGTGSSELFYKEMFWRRQVKGTEKRERAGRVNKAWQEMDRREAEDGGDEEGAF